MASNRRNLTLTIEAGKWYPADKLTELIDAARNVESHYLLNSGLRWMMEQTYTPGDMDG